MPDDCVIVGGLNTGDEHRTDTTGTLGHVMAHRYDVTDDMTVDAIQIHTGEYETASRVAIWSDDITTSSPGMEEAGAAFDTSTAVGWQGARLSSPAAYLAGDIIWVSWHTTPGLTSVGSTGTEVTYKWAWIGESTWNGPWEQPMKFRLLNCGS